MSRTDGSTSDQFRVPQWYPLRYHNTSEPVSDRSPAWAGFTLSYSQRSDDEHNITPDNNEPLSGDDFNHESFPYTNAGDDNGALVEDTFQYLPRSSNVASSFYNMEPSYATGEPAWIENYPSLDLVPPPNTPVTSSFDDEDYSPVPFNFDFGGTENSHLFDYTEDEEDTPDPFSLLFETAEIASLFDDTDIDDEEELEWEIYSYFNPQASIGDSPSEYDEPHPESPEISMTGLNECFAAVGFEVAKNVELYDDRPFWWPLWLSTSLALLCKIVLLVIDTKSIWF